MGNHYTTSLANHSRDPTGSQGETNPIWFDLWEEFVQWKESHSTNAAAQNNRANMREVQMGLQAVQPPLGPGNPSLRSEVANENRPQLGGPQIIGDGIQVRRVVNQNNSLASSASGNETTVTTGNTTTANTGNNLMATTGTPLEIALLLQIRTILQ